MEEALCDCIMSWRSGFNFPAGTSDFSLCWSI